MELPRRKNIRVKDYDYSQNGAYFITICVEGHRKLLGAVVGCDDLGALIVRLSEYGIIVQENIELIESYYKYVFVDKYVIMPNHVHMIIALSNPLSGVPRSSRPTAQIPSIIAAFKKFTAKEMTMNIWQTSYHDHIIRNEADCLRIWQYIDENPAKWEDDKYFSF